ncbi:MAG: hypothetical protein LDL31_13595, partial [Prosthecobacter sp.]|nr:hypothetical protein [Prosthecobacter sp.]
MNPRFPALLCFLLFVCSPVLRGQVTSAMVGFLKLNLQPGPNFIGFALLPMMEVQSTFNISGTDRRLVSLQGAGITLADGQFSPGSLPTHAVEIISPGAGLGFTSVITATAASGNQLTLAQEVPAGVSDGAVLKVWKLWRIADVFGAANSAGLTSGETPGEADLILLPDAQGVTRRFFYSSGGAQGVGWRQVGGDSTSSADVPILLSEGMAILAKSAKTILVIGQVKQGNTQISLRTGHNYVANLCPVHAEGSTLGRRLGTSGLAEGLTGGTSPSLADLVLLWNGRGYDQYYYSTGGLAGAGWRKVGAGNQNQETVPLP